MAPGSAVFHGPIDPGKAAWGIGAGVVFSIGNVLLVAAISLTGMAVAFPVCIGLALLIGVGLSWYIKPCRARHSLGDRMGLILLSMVMDAAAYRAKAAIRCSRPAASSSPCWAHFHGGLSAVHREGHRRRQRAGPLRRGRDARLGRPGVYVGDQLRLHRGVRLPAVRRSRSASSSPHQTRYHALGIIGGAIWATGGVLNFVAGGKVSMAISYAFGAGATLVAALWGVLVWKEFRGAPRSSYLYLLGMFVTFLAASPSSPGPNRPCPAKSYNKDSTT